MVLVFFVERGRENWTFKINSWIFTSCTGLLFANSYFKYMKFKSPFCSGSPFFMSFLLPPRVRLLPGMHAFSSVAGRGTASSLHSRNSGGWYRNLRGRYWREGESTCWSLAWDVHSGGRQLFLGIYRYGGRFKDRPCVPIPYNPEVRSTFCGRHVHLEQTCSVIYYSFIFFFNSPFLCWHVPYLFMVPLLIFSAHFTVSVFVRNIPNFFWCCRRQSPSATMD